MPYKVSVVVPFHNVAPYLERCVTSLFSQTLEEIQFVFVDDHSTDESVEVLNGLLARFPSKKGQTLFLHLGEGEKGIPSARRVGQEHAEGEYIAQCDSDDYMESDMYETLYRAAVDQDADIVECDFWHDNGYFSRLRRHQEPGENLVRDFLDGSIWPFVWCRLVRADVCGKVQFSRRNYLEDWYMSVQQLHYSRKAVVVHRPLYHYCFNQQSISHDFTYTSLVEKLEDCKENYRLVHDFVAMHYSFDEEDFISKKVSVKEKCLPLLAQTGDARCRRLYLDTFPEVNGRLLFSPKVPIERKTEFLAVVLGLYPLMDKARRLYRGMRRRTVLEGMEPFSGEMCRRMK